MPRYFIEVMYKGTGYAGFQAQDNAITIQGEMERALQIYFRRKIALTCSSRTDAGVHAKQNYFHFDDCGSEIEWQSAVYHLNAILPQGIVIKGIRRVLPDAHSRFDAESRVYEYSLYVKKNPFWEDRAYYFPYRLDIHRLNEAAEILLATHDFEAFSKKNTQVKTFQCVLKESKWGEEGERVVYRVEGNRFLRGMVRGLVGTMLRVGTGKASLEKFREIIESKDCRKADFSMPPEGLMLIEVRFSKKIYHQDDRLEMQ